MAEEPVTPPAIDPKNDVIEDLFPEVKPVVPATPAPTTPAEPPKPGEGEGDDKDKKPEINVEEIVGKAVDQAVERIKPLIGQQGNEVARQREIDNFFATEDGKMFGTYRDTIERAAKDPRFAGLRLSQIPAAILKPASYTRIISDAKIEADKAAKDTRTGGDTARGHETGDDKDAPDYKNMSREDFKKVADENALKIKRS